MENKHIKCNAIQKTDSIHQKQGKNTAGNREGLPTVNYSCFNFKFVSHNNSSIDEAPTASAAFKTM